MRRRKRIDVRYLPKTDPVRRVYRIKKSEGIPIELPKREEVGIPVELPERKKNANVES